MVVTRTGSHRPPVMGTTHAVSTGHYLASAAGMRVLESGGNAIDAGVAAGICLNVLLPEMCGFGGVAPIMVYLADEDRVVSLNGVGTWPRAASVDYFMDVHNGEIPPGVSRIVVPAAAGDWLTALEMWGTKSFAEVVEPALGLARDGFALHFTGAEGMSSLVDAVSDWPSSMSTFAPEGRPLRFGERMVQADLASTFERLIAAEKSKSPVSREAGIRAAREEFYRGGIGEQITQFVQGEGGLLDLDDLGNFEVEVEETVTASFGEHEIYASGPWCQGPVLAETLQILQPDDFRSLEHNSVEYVHMVTEALKLGFADRDAFIGDPKFADVPIAGLTSPEFAASRRAQMDPNRATPEMPDFGDPWRFENRTPPESWRYVTPSAIPVAAEFDTSYASAVDRWGNAFSATPSDGAGGSPIVPGLGFVPSNRGAQSWLDERHPSSVEGGKRPRLTPNPAIVFRDGKLMMPFGTPGGDAQPQSMTQVFLNMAVYGMNVQAAVEAPRFQSKSFPNSFYPHSYRPGVLQLEGAFDPGIGEGLSRLGHEIEWLQTYDAGMGAVCGIEVDSRAGTLSAGADMRRESYAIGR
ncbi:MAG: gamma-glutamyltransferase family protein [Chloroflexi bacterium]|nr:gamma-glutamyltransferase family protein [Chloroflexota bacterium]MCI0871778.1 gamma-glutamyltransferase family protein [Chloroflexota bacterium]